MKKVLQCAVLLASLSWMSMAFADVIIPTRIEMVNVSSQPMVVIYQACYYGYGYGGDSGKLYPHLIGCNPPASLSVDAWGIAGVTLKDGSFCTGLSCDVGHWKVSVSQVSTTAGNITTHFGEGECGFGDADAFNALFFDISGQKINCAAT